MSADARDVIERALGRAARATKRRGRTPDVAAARHLATEQRPEDGRADGDRGLHLLLTVL